MKKEKTNIEFIEEKEEPRAQRRGLFREFIDGTLLVRESVTRQLPFILFLTLLLLLFIGNRYHAERIVRRTDLLEKELNELRAEAISVASEYNRLNKPSEVYKLVEEKGLGLEESTDPPFILKDKK